MIAMAIHGVVEQEARPAAGRGGRLNIATKSGPGPATKLAPRAGDSGNLSQVEAGTIGNRGSVLVLTIGQKAPIVKEAMPKALHAGVPLCLPSSMAKWVSCSSRESRGPTTLGLSWQPEGLWRREGISWDRKKHLSDDEACVPDCVPSSYVGLLGTSIGMIVTVLGSS